MPIYLITAAEVTQTPVRLVEAPTRAQAIAHLVRTAFKVSTPSVSEALIAMRDGATFEQAGDAPAEPDAPE